jgi:hypothetical protein
VMGHARLRPEIGVPHDSSGGEVYGGIVDVSAGGTRLRVRPGVSVEPGAIYLVDLEVAIPDQRGPSTPVRLNGRGLTLRFQATEAARGAEVTIRFEGPLQVTDGIGVTPPAFAIPSSAAVGDPLPTRST